MIVICVEGTHGTGKSSVCGQLSACGGFEVLDEGFLTMPSYKLHPQTLVMETLWVTSWMERLLRVQQEHEEAHVAAGGEPGTAPERVFIADRSPYSAVFYAGEHGHLLEPLIRQSLLDLAEKAGIHVVTVCLDVPPDTLWGRIQERLAREPSRVKYNEHKREWMETTNDWYRSRDWDLVVSTGEGLDRTLQLLLQTLAEGVEGFHRFCETNPKVKLPDHLPGDHPLRRPSSPSLSSAASSSEDSSEDDDDEASPATAATTTAADSTSSSTAASVSPALAEPATAAVEVGV